LKVGVGTTAYNYTATALLKFFAILISALCPKSENVIG
jgi:hypothetical protein